MRMKAFRILRIVSGFWLALMAVAVHSEEIPLNPDHPSRYVVRRGDTLWDIAGKFLSLPWQWPLIWHENPHIANPHWIYPGDELVLSMVNGQPSLQVARAGESSGDWPDDGTLKPKIRVLPLGQAIPTIPLSSVQSFLTQPKVAEVGELERAPYILAFAEDHVTGGRWDNVYVRGLPAQPQSGYMIFRAGKPYYDAETEEVLGYEALYVGDLELKSTGEPATMEVLKSDREIYIGDRVIPFETEKLRMNFFPHPPLRAVNGHIIAVMDGVSQIGQYSIVILDRGAKDGLDVGAVLQVTQSGRQVRDIVSPLVDETVNLPADKEGVVLVFRSFQRVSFALVMSASRAIHLKDAVTNP